MANHTPHLTTAKHLGHILKWSAVDPQNSRYRTQLYRFLTDQIPLINAAIWTWVRLSSAPGAWRIVDPIHPDKTSTNEQRALARLEQLTTHFFGSPHTRAVTLDAMLPDLFATLFRDGLFAGVLTVTPDASSVDRFIPIDPADIIRDTVDNKPALFLERDTSRIPLDRPDFYYIPFGASIADPFGRSILQAIPFVAYIEQQLVDDMRRSSHNAGFHRLHVKITPPERSAGESDQAYTTRINEYFDATVEMIRQCDVDDNPVTWNNVEIDYIGPDRSRDITNSWFMSHRAMIEDICAGANLAPFLLGYSYGATTTWSSFKFDVVMRQVRSIQAEVCRFLEWIGNIDLALAGIDAKCRFVFDNTFAYQATESVTVQTSRIDNLLKLHQAGLIDDNTAKTKANDLL